MIRKILTHFIIFTAILTSLFPVLTAAQSGRTTCASGQAQVSRDGKNVCITPEQAVTLSECKAFGSNYVFDDYLYECTRKSATILPVNPPAPTKPDEAQDIDQCKKFASQGYTWQYVGGHGADGLGYACMKPAETSKDGGKKDVVVPKDPDNGNTDKGSNKTDSVQLGGCPDANYEKIPGGICVPKQKEITGVDCNAEVNKGSPVCIRTVGSLLATILRYMLGFSAVIATIFIVYGGYVYMTAAGKEDDTKKGRNIATSAVVGLVITMLAWAIITIVTRFFTERAF